ncbi:hypothetical protein V6C27_00915 [Peptococcaceae bacterium 1198_IL3148]
MLTDYSKLLVDKTDQQGVVEFTIKDEEFFNNDVKEVTLFYSIVGAARFKLFRNHKFELILVHVTDDWMRQAKVDVSPYKDQLDVKITWDDATDTLSIRGLNESDFHTVQAMQIDN